MVKDSLIVPSAAGEPDSVKTQTGSPAESLLPIISSQRERFHQRVQELEDHSLRQQQQLHHLQSEMDRLQTDNVKLYEKIRFLQSYPTSGQVIYYIVVLLYFCSAVILTFSSSSYPKMSASVFICRKFVIQTMTRNVVIIYSTKKTWIRLLHSVRRSVEGSVIGLCWGFIPNHIDVIGAPEEILEPESFRENNSWYGSHDLVQQTRSNCDVLLQRSSSLFDFCGDYHLLGEMWCHSQWSFDFSLIFCLWRWWFSGSL